MSKQLKGDIMKYGELNLGQIEALVNKLGGMDGVKRFLAGSIDVVVKKILTLVTTVKVVAVERFIASEKFIADKTVDGVKIAWLGDNIKANFLGKTEETVEAVELKLHKLDQDALDAPIIAELGNAAETTLAHFWELLKKQGSGQKGDLLTNGYANIAYIRDENGKLWAVSARWSAGSDGWLVEAVSVEGPSGWGAGRRVVSR